MLNPKAHQTAPVRVLGTAGLDALGAAPAPGSSVTESRPSPGGGGLATSLTLEFIARSHRVRNGRAMADGYVEVYERRIGGTFFPEHAPAAASPAQRYCQPVVPLHLNGAPAPPCVTRGRRLRAVGGRFGRAHPRRRCALSRALLGTRGEW
jgi:hypothetical protein